MATPELEVADKWSQAVLISDAQLAARRALGSVARTKEELRDVRTGAAFERLWQERAPYAGRSSDEAMTASTSRAV